MTHHPKLDRTRGGRPRSRRHLRRSSASLVLASRSRPAARPAPRQLLERVRPRRASAARAPSAASVQVPAAPRATAVEAVQGASDEDQHHDPAQGRPAERQDDRDARDEQPFERASSSRAWRSSPHGTLELLAGQLRPRQPGHVHAAVDHRAGQASAVPRRGGPPADGVAAGEGEERGREVDPRLRLSGHGQAAGHRPGATPMPRTL